MTYNRRLKKALPNPVKKALPNPGHGAAAEDYTPSAPVSTAPIDAGPVGAPLPDNGWSPDPQNQDPQNPDPQVSALPASGGLNEGLAKMQRWLGQFAEATDPFSKWMSHSVHVSEETDDDQPSRDDLQQGQIQQDPAERYPAFLSAPPDFNYNQTFPLQSGATASPLTKAVLSSLWEGIARVYPGIRELSPPSFGPIRLVKKVSGALPDGGRWITVHPNHDPDTKGHPVYIVPNPDGSHSVVAGAGGSLNGLRLTGVKSPEEYKRFAQTRKAERKFARQKVDEARQREVGMAQWLQEQAAKKQALEEGKSAQRELDRGYVRDVLTARGHDTSIMDIPAERLAGLTAPQKERLLNEHHRALVSYADAVASGVEDKLRSGWGDAVLKSSGDLTAGDIVGQLASDRGKGYQAGVESLARDRGLDPSLADDAAREASWRRILDSKGGDVDAAGAAQEAIGRRVEASQNARAQTRQAAQELGQVGVGPDVVRQLSEEPDQETMAQSAAILAARKRRQEGKKRLGDLARQIDAGGDLDRLPRGMAVVEHPLSDDEALNAVAHDLDQATLSQKMNELIQTSNSDALAPGLERHLSVGHNAALGAIMAATLPGSVQVDPLTHDTLGVSVVAHALARRITAKKEARLVLDALSQNHVATQAKIAQEGVEQAQEHLAAAEQIPDTPVADHPEGLAGALLDLDRKEEHLDMARSAAGVARGRVEATAAVIGALQGMGANADGSVLTTLGAISPREAIDALGAVGLTKPTRTDEQGNVVEPGDYTLHHDGTNAIVEVHPQGLDKLIEPEDQEKADRARLSRAIKLGKHDTSDFHPEGITRRVKTSMELDPGAFVQTGHVLRIPEATSPDDVAALVTEHIGARIQEGQDPFDVIASLSSASFISGLGLSRQDEQTYRDALSSVAPAAPSYPPGATLAQKGELAKLHRERTRQRLVAMAESYVQTQKERGLLTEEQAALDSQHVPITSATRDLVYQAALADPRTRFAFHKMGDLGREGREAIRSYAFEKLFGLDPKSDEIITPLSPDERAGFEAWRDLKTHGEPYSQIQDLWRRSASQDSGLFGAPEIPALASVDMRDQVALLAAVRSDPRALGFMPNSPEIHAGEFSAEVPDPDKPGEKKVVTLQRTDEDIARVCRQRLRKLLVKKFFELSGHQNLGATAFNPERVVTASGRWKDYYRAVGSEEKAIQTVQEIMAGDVSARFAAMYQRKTGQKLTLADRTLLHADRHAQAMMPQEMRQEEESSPRALQALLQKTGKGGRFGAGEVKSRLEATQALAQGSQLDLLDTQDAELARSVSTSRPSLGKMAEGALSQMLPHMDVSRAQEAASDVTFADENGVKLQRAIRLIQANKRQGLNLQAGLGKTLAGLAAFSDSFAKGNARRMLYVTPSNVVEQVGGECWKFLDPELGLRWYSRGSAAPQERHGALGDADTHIVVTTPESLREDITGAVAADLGMGKDRAILHLAELTEAERDKVIHGAMQKRGWNFDFSIFDEGHRLLGREGKPDAHMARVADSVARRSRHFVYSTADPVKNDASEVWSVLNKLDPKRYSESGKSAFLRRFGRNTRAARVALQREVEPYLYAERGNIGVGLETQTHVLKLTPDQQSQYDTIMGAYQQARAAKARGEVDLDALQVMFPHRFTGNPETDESLGQAMTKALGAVRDAALARVVHSADGVKGDWAVSETKRQVEQGRGVTVFARNLDSVQGIAARLSQEGLRVATLTGSMSGKEKARAMKAFSPPKGQQPLADVIVSSDAGAMGANLQRGSVQIQLDTPATDMLRKQRAARNWRRGQESDVLVHELVADVPMEHQARKRVMDKADLREIMNSPAEEIDDSGLLLDIERGRMQRAERLAT